VHSIGHVAVDVSLAWLDLGMHVPPQHCFEPSDGGSQYRRVVAARLASRDDIVVHASEYAGRRLRDAARLLLDCARDVRLGASHTCPEVMLPIDLAFQCCLSVINCRLSPMFSHVEAAARLLLDAPVTCASMRPPAAPR